MLEKIGYCKMENIENLVTKHTRYYLCDYDIENTIIVFSDEVEILQDNGAFVGGTQSITLTFEEIKELYNTITNKQYTMKDLRKYYKDLKENISAEEYKIYAPKESKNIIELEIGTEEIIINKQNNTVISSFKNYNSVHDIVEGLLIR